MPESSGKVYFHMSFFYAVCLYTYQSVCIALSVHGSNQAISLALNLYRFQFLAQIPRDVSAMYPINTQIDGFAASLGQGLTWPKMELRWACWRGA